MAIARCVWWQQLQLARIIYRLVLLSNRSQSARIMYRWVYCQIDCNQLGSCIDEYILKLIAISLDRVSMSILLNWLQSAWIVYRWVYRWWFRWWFHRWVWRSVQRWVPLGCAGLSTSAKRSTAQTRCFYGYQLRGFNRLVVEQTHRFTDSFYRLFNGYQPRGHKGYYNSDLTLL